MEYNFTLKYQLGESDRDIDSVVERLGEAGCDDALVGLGQPGRLALEFTREADSAEDAMFSALADVRSAAPSAKLIEAAPDFVGLTDVAELIGVSRQNMRKLMQGHPASFPAPVHEGSSSIWHLAELLAWLESKGGYQLSKSNLEIAQAALKVNSARERTSPPTPFSQRVRALLIEGERLIRPIATVKRPVILWRGRPRPATRI